MGKNTKNHSRDRSATNALRRVFPDSWLFKNPRDSDSGREYAEDWLIEIVDEDDDVTGMEFGIQNKTQLYFTQNHVSVPIDIDDIERAIDLKKPFLLHAYHKGSRTSYWIWLDEWYGKNFSSAWKQQENISVDIPLDQTLDEKSVEAIKAHVSWDHQKRKAQKLADLINSTQSQDFHVQVEIINNHIILTINSQRDETIPIVRPLNDVANNALQKYLATGEGGALPPDAKFALDGVPNLYAEDGSVELVEAVLIPYVPSEIRAFTIQFLDLEGGVVLETPLVLMSIQNTGYALTRWKGEFPEQGITYTLLENHQEDNSQLSINIGPTSIDIQGLKRYSETLAALDLAKKYRTINRLSSEQLDYDRNAAQPKDFSPIRRAIDNFLSELSLIEAEFKLSFPKNQPITALDLSIANAIAHIIPEGRSPLNVAKYVADGNWLETTDNAGHVREMLAYYDQTGNVDIFISDYIEDVKLPLLNHTIELGQARHEYKNCKIKNVEELRERLNATDLADDAIVEIQVDIDRENAWLSFLDWPKNSN